VILNMITQDQDHSQMNLQLVNPEVKDNGIL
jgi:hypothetical protein